MFKHDMLEILHKAEPAILSKIIEQLNDNGIILDEDISPFTSTAMEQWNESCDNFIRNKGYLGGNILCGGKFYGGHGAVYALFDKERYDHLKAREYIDTYIQNYNINNNE
ncbi:hypothetical protein QJU96_01095 [Pasteurella skyensis]|uniref:hypothetical protein n=1 Tax=Phocoenobacter skyensis TaxID=97481 RepID=UPI0027926EA4|nr:hypothetical protein [Pasteurella skyensis]MDP8169887.1 hypothetical protein [Pasteurella skyensis]